MTGPINISGLKNAHATFLRDLRYQIDSAQAEAGRIIESNVESTGAFKNKSADGLTKHTETKVIRTRRGSLLVVSNPDKHALSQERGSGTHAGRGKYVIRGKRGGALKFFVDGKAIIRRQVMHPGVPATYFLRKAILASEPRELQLLNSRMADAAGRFNRKRV